MQCWKCLLNSFHFLAVLCLSVPIDHPCYFKVQSSANQFRSDPSRIVGSIYAKQKVLYLGLDLKTLCALDTHAGNFIWRNRLLMEQHDNDKDERQRVVIQEKDRLVIAEPNSMTVFEDHDCLFLIVFEMSQTSPFTTSWLLRINLTDGIEMERIKIEGSCSASSIDTVHSKTRRNLTNYVEYSRDGTHWMLVPVNDIVGSTDLNNVHGESMVKIEDQWYFLSTNEDIDDFDHQKVQNYYKFYQAQQPFNEASSSSSSLRSGVDKGHVSRCGRHIQFSDSPKQLLKVGDMLLVLLDKLPGIAPAVVSYNTSSTRHPSNQQWSTELPQCLEGLEMITYDSVESGIVLVTCFSNHVTHVDHQREQVHEERNEFQKQLIAIDSRNGSIIWKYDLYSFLSPQALRQRPSSSSSFHSFIKKKQWFMSLNQPSRQRYHWENVMQQPSSLLDGDQFEFISSMIPSDVSMKVLKDGSCLVWLEDQKKLVKISKQGHVSTIMKVDPHQSTEKEEDSQQVAVSCGGNDEKEQVCVFLDVPQTKQSGPTCGLHAMFMVMQYHQQQPRSQSRHRKQEQPSTHIPESVEQLEIATTTWTRHLITNVGDEILGSPLSQKILSQQIKRQRGYPMAREEKEEEEERDLMRRDKESSFRIKSYEEFIQSSEDISFLQEPLLLLQNRQHHHNNMYHIHKDWPKSWPSYDVSAQSSSLLYLARELGYSLYGEMFNLTQLGHLVSIVGVKKWKEGDDGGSGGKGLYDIKETDISVDIQKDKEADVDEIDANASSTTNNNIHRSKRDNTKKWLSNIHKRQAINEETDLLKFESKIHHLPSLFDIYHILTFKQHPLIVPFDVNHRGDPLSHKHGENAHYAVICGIIMLPSTNHANSFTPIDKKKEVVDETQSFSHDFNSDGNNVHDVDYFIKHEDDFMLLVKHSWNQRALHLWTWKEFQTSWLSLEATSFYGNPDDPAAHGLPHGFNDDDSEGEHLLQRPRHAPNDRWLDFEQLTSIEHSLKGFMLEIIPKS